MKAWRISLIGLALALMGPAAWASGELDTLNAKDVPTERALIQKMIDRHGVAAAQYLEKAKAMQAFMEQHRKMLGDYEKERGASLPKDFGVSTEDMSRHCEAIIRDARALQEECQAFANWHRQRAQALQQRLARLE